MTRTVYDRSAIRLMWCEPGPVGDAPTVFFTLESTSAAAAVSTFRRKPTTRSRGGIDTNRPRGQAAPLS